MNKEEILEKSRREHKDEGLIDAENKGRGVGITAFCIVFVIIVIFNFFHGQNNNAPFAMFWAFMAAEAYPKYKFTKSTSSLITTIAGGIAAFFFLLSFIITGLR